MSLLRLTRAEARLLVIVTRFLSENLRGRPVLVQAGGREQDWLHEIDFRLRTPEVLARVRSKDFVLMDSSLSAPVHPRNCVNLG